MLLLCLCSGIPREERVFSNWTATTSGHSFKVIREYINYGFTTVGSRNYYRFGALQSSTSASPTANPCWAFIHKAHTIDRTDSRSGSPVPLAKSPKPPHRSFVISWTLICSCPYWDWMDVESRTLKSFLTYYCTLAVSPARMNEWVNGLNRTSTVSISRMDPINILLTAKHLLLFTDRHFGQTDEEQHWLEDWTSSRRSWMNQLQSVTDSIWRQTTPF